MTFIIIVATVITFGYILSDSEAQRIDLNTPLHARNQTEINKSFADLPPNTVHKYWRSFSEGLRVYQCNVTDDNISSGADWQSGGQCFVNLNGQPMCRLESDGSEVLDHGNQCQSFINYVVKSNEKYQNHRRNTVKKTQRNCRPCRASCTFRVTDPDKRGICIGAGKCVYKGFAFPTIHGQCPGGRSSEYCDPPVGNRIAGFCGMKDGQNMCVANGESYGHSPECWTI